MRRTFTIQLHDVPSQLPLMCPACDQVVVSAASAPWWTKRAITPWCNDCSAPPDDSLHYPCPECAIATESITPLWRSCPACEDRGSSLSTYRTAACHPHPDRNVALARRRPWGPLRTCRRCPSTIQMRYDYCEHCIDQMRILAGIWSDEALPPQGFQCRSTIR